MCNYKATLIPYRSLFCPQVIRPEHFDSRCCNIQTLQIFEPLLYSTPSSSHIFSLLGLLFPSQSLSLSNVSSGGCSIFLIIIIIIIIHYTLLCSCFQQSLFNSVGPANHANQCATWLSSRSQLFFSMLFSLFLSFPMASSEVPF